MRSLSSKNHTVLLASCLALLMSRTSFAGPQDIAVILPGGGLVEEQAAPYLKQLMDYVAPRLGWAADTSKVRFFSDVKSATAEIGQFQPGYVILNVDLFLEWRKSKNLVPLALLIAKQQSFGRMHLMVKGNTIKNLQEAKGKSLVSSHLDSPRFLSKVAFAGKIDVSKYFSAVRPVLGMLKAAKLVDRGEADVALFTEGDYDALQRMDSIHLESIWTSDPVPPPVVVSVGPARGKDGAGVGKVLQQMCADPKGVDICKAFEIEKFAPINQAAYDKAIKQFGSQ